METNIFKEEIIDIVEQTFNIDVKQELDEYEHSVNGKPNGISPIEKVVKVHLNTYITLEECDANGSIERKSNIEYKLHCSNGKRRMLPQKKIHTYIRRKRTKFRGCSLNGKFIKTQDHLNGIICAVCGNLYTNKVEYFNHNSIHHSLRKNKLQKTQFNKKYTASLTYLTEDVKHDIEIVKHEPRHELNYDLEETKSCAQLSGIDGYKPYSCEIIENAQAYHGRPFKCDVCLKYFTRNSHLNEHLRCHTGERPFKCETCLKSFSLKNNLITHLRCHTGEKPFKCDVCLKSFSRKIDLVVHIRRHTGEKPFKCDVCLTSFARKTDLNIHFRCHTGEKPFKCDVCFKHFTRRTGLNIHLRCHTGEKPFECEICLKSFSRKSSLNTHFRSHTGEKPFECEICLKSFSLKSNLSKHLRCHKREKPFKSEIFST